MEESCNQHGWPASSLNEFSPYTITKIPVVTKTKLSWWKSSSVLWYSLSCSSGSLTIGLRWPFPFVCAMGHAAAFTVNTTLVASPWQHRAFLCTQLLTKCTVSPVRWKSGEF